MDWNRSCSDAFKLHQASFCCPDSNGKAFISMMAYALPYPFLDVPHYGARDKWGPKSALFTSEPDATTDLMWRGIKSFLRFPCARADLNVQAINLLSGNPGNSGIRETWLVIKSASLQGSYLEDYRRDGGEMPQDLWNVLRSVHEHRDGLETVIIKHVEYIDGRY